MSLRHLPNAITIGRILLIGPIIWAMFVGHFQLALWLLVAAGLSDIADGILAKRFGWQSPLGAVLDPAADKALALLAFLTLAWLGLIPLWLVGTVFARDLIIISWHAVNYYFFEPVRPEPSVVSKINTVCQVACVILVMLAAGYYVHPVLLESWFIITFLTTVFSGLQYMSIYLRPAR